MSNYVGKRNVAAAKKRAMGMTRDEKMAFAKKKSAEEAAVLRGVLTDLALPIPVLVPSPNDFTQTELKEMVEVGAACGVIPPAAAKSFRVTPGHTWTPRSGAPRLALLLNASGGRDGYTLVEKEEQPRTEDLGVKGSGDFINRMDIPAAVMIALGAYDRDGEYPEAQTRTITAMIRSIKRGEGGTPMEIHLRGRSIYYDTVQKIDSKQILERSELGAAMADPLHGLASISSHESMEEEEEPAAAAAAPSKKRKRGGKLEVVIPRADGVEEPDYVPLSPSYSPPPKKKPKKAILRDGEVTTEGYGESHKKKKAAPKKPRRVVPHLVGEVQSVTPTLLTRTDSVILTPGPPKASD